MTNEEAVAQLAEMPTGSVRSVERVSVAKNEVLVIECDVHVSRDMANRIRAVVEQVFPHTKCLVLEKGTTLKSVTLDA